MLRNLMGSLRSSPRRTLTLFMGMSSLLWCGVAQAQELGGDQRARPGLYRVGAPQLGTPGKLTVAAGASGGITEGLSSSDSAHGRAAGSAAVSVDAARFLNFGAWLSGRYDAHPHDEGGKDDGFLVEPELSARVSSRLGRANVGFELAGFLPGGPDLRTSFKGASADGKLEVLLPLATAFVAGHAGYRLDRTARGAGKVLELRNGDRSALGASDFNAVLLGIGCAYPSGKTLLFGEVTAQALLGSPRLAASPVRVSLGARQQLAAPGLAAELVLDTLASARPRTPLGDPLFPLEPRVTLRFGLSYRFGEPPPRQPKPEAPTPIERLKPTPQPEPSTPPVAAAQGTDVELALVDDSGQPLTRARATVTRARATASPESPAEAHGPLVEIAPGRYRLERVEPGRWHLHVEADGFRTIDRDLEVTSGEPVKLEVRAEVATPAGQVRGLVRSYAGKPLAATVHVEPGGAQATTDPEGFFQIDVAPGQYEVVIEAPGYTSQRRMAKVERQGVVIVNADLARRPAGPRGSSSP